MEKHYQPSPKDAQGHRETLTNIRGDQTPEDEKLHPEDRYGLILPQGTYSSRIAVLLDEPSPVIAVECEPSLAGDHPREGSQQSRWHTL